MAIRYCYRLCRRLFTKPGWKAGKRRIGMSKSPHKTTRSRSVRWYLYLMACSDGTFYTGITTDLARRLSEHNNGTASRYTRSRLPVKLIYQERCQNKSSALKKECEIKALSRKEKEHYILFHRGPRKKTSKFRLQIQTGPV